MLLGRLSGAFGISMSTLIARAEMQEGEAAIALRLTSPSGTIRKATICAAMFHRAAICLSIWCRLNYRWK